MGNDLGSNRELQSIIMGGFQSIDKDCQSCQTYNMPTQNVNLTDKLAKFIRESVKTGDYNNASEVVREALRLLKAQKDEHQAKLDVLRAELQKGIDAYERGEYIELNNREEISQHFESIKKRGMERLAKETDASTTPTD